MKKLILLTTCLLAAVIVNGQTLDEIIKKYTVANKLDKISAFKTVKITASMNMMGQDMPIEIWMKNPDKVKQVVSFGGQEIIQLWDGTKGYTINPMTGSSTPVEVPADQVSSLRRSNSFFNYMANDLKEGKLTLVGEDVVNGKPAFKIKAAISADNSATIYIDKESYYIVKTSADVNQNGQAMTVETYPSDYKETNGIIYPSKTSTSVSGMDMVMTFNKIEVDFPMDDSVFVLK
jgi:hypothetical protein